MTTLDFSQRYMGKVLSGCCGSNPSSVREPATNRNCDGESLECGGTQPKPSAPSPMKAAYIESCGAAEATIKYGELPQPTPTGSQVLVKVVAVAVNPIDTY